MCGLLWMRWEQIAVIVVESLIRVNDYGHWTRRVHTKIFNPCQDRARAPESRVLGNYAEPPQTTHLSHVQLAMLTKVLALSKPTPLSQLPWNRCIFPSYLYVEVHATYGNSLSLYIGVLYRPTIVTSLLKMCLVFMKPYDFKRTSPSLSGSCQSGCWRRFQRPGRTTCL